MKSSWAVCLAALIGFLLGVLVHPRPVSAALGRVSITRLANQDLRGATSFQGTNVVGMSCIVDEGEPECYIATQ